MDEKTSASAAASQTESARQHLCARPEASAPAPRSPYLRAANEDDDGYDPYSDRRPEPEPLFERDPWR